MRTLITVCLILFCLPQFAQTGEASKEEIKKWKDMAKEYKKEPLKLRDKIEGYENMVEELQTDADQLKEEKSDLEKDKSQMQSQIIDLKAQVAKLKREMAAKDSMLQAQMSTDSNGLQFYVQIGAYKFFNMNDYFTDQKCMDVQLNEGLNKYVVGSFGDITKAESFRKDVVKLGIDDAWVLPMMNGQRIPMEDALNMLEQNGTLTAEQLQHLRDLYLK